VGIVVGNSNKLQNEVWKENSLNAFKLRLMILMLNEFLS
jgi:hypothetical protein